MNYLTVDFGSTYTKLTAIDAVQAEIKATASSFTTIETNIMDGYKNALALLEEKTGPITYDKVLCCSSAGGGLKMVALGLVPELTAKAAKMAASSAGAKVIKTYAFEISKEEQDEIASINPDLVLLCGGTDGGNKEVIINNAKRLCAIDSDFSIIAAGNKSASYELEEIFKDSGKDYVITKNVMPQFNRLDIEPAKKSITSLFIQKIIEAKGLSRVQEMSYSDVIPTPLAVMSACELLSKGTKEMEGLGELMAIDLGGATTDVYSMASGKPTHDNILEKGLPEPFSKRTVEGDLGMRYSLTFLADEIDLDSPDEENEISKEHIQNWVASCTNNPDTIAATAEEIHIEEFLAKNAIRIATDRHCGIMEKNYSPMGEIYSLTGKDLTNIPYVLGIGGAIINSPNPAYVLRGVMYNPKQFDRMKPKNPTYLLDEKYIFASMGLLSAIDPALALTILKKDIKQLNTQI